MGTFWIAKDAKFFHADEDSDQTTQMCRLICVFDGCAYQKVHFLILWLKCRPVTYQLFVIILNVHLGLYLPNKKTMSFS